MPIGRTAVPKGKRRPKGGSAIQGRTLFEISSVQPVGNLAMFRSIRRDIGVQQKKPQPANVDTPDLGGDFSIRKFHPNDHVRDQLDRPCVKIIVFERFLLPAGGVQILAEVSLLVQQSHTDQRKAEVARSFQVVSGQNAQAAGKDRKTLGDSKLSGEIGNQQTFFRAMLAAESKKKQ